MITDLTVLFAGFVIITFIIAIMKESTVMFILSAAFSFIMCAMVRLIVMPYAFIDSADAVVTGSFVLDDVSATILFFVLGIINVVCFFAYRVQHSAEELQQKQRGD